MDHEHWMRQALLLAGEAERCGEVPVGAIVVREGIEIGRGWNQPIARHDPTAHAEIVALRAAAARAGNYRLPGATLYVTLEPCVMCAGALIQARLQRVVFAAPEPRSGAAGSVFDIFSEPRLTHRVECIGGVLASDAKELMQRFFRGKRLAAESSP